MNGYNIMNIPTPIGGQMKPIRMYPGRDLATLRRQQEEYVINVLSTQDYSISAAGLAQDIKRGIMTRLQENFPTRYEPNGTPDLRPRSISQVLRRLESKGRVISTLYQGRRYYCIAGEEVK